MTELSVSGSYSAMPRESVRIIGGVPGREVIRKEHVVIRVFLVDGDLDLRFMGKGFDITG